MSLYQFLSVLDKVIYQLPVNDVIRLCKLGIIDYEKSVVDFDKSSPFWRRYYQNNPYEYIKYDLQCKSAVANQNNILIEASRLGSLPAVKKAIRILF
jgi:hypothetical protein